MKFIDRFIVKPGCRVRLKDYDPADTASYKSKDQAEVALEKNAARLDNLQFRLYAEDKRAVLVVLQALDAGGKDGTIRHVMSGLNPQGCGVTSFKVPSEEERQHDFLWRIHQAVPPRREIGIFNRSHYEDVLVVRVHNLVDKEVWARRYGLINDFEKQLADAGVLVLKFFLHISKDEQLKRFKERLEDPSKQWKISQADFDERKYWDDYVAAYEDAIAKCSTAHAPWFIIPADRKWFRNLAVSQILVESMEKLNMKFPKPAIDVSKIKIE